MGYSVEEISASSEDFSVHSIVQSCCNQQCCRSEVIKETKEATCNKCGLQEKIHENTEADFKR